MYFIPQKNRWFSFFAAIPPLYRYAGLMAGLVLVLAVWRYGLYAWLDSALVQEQASVARLQNQLVSQLQAEHQHSDFVAQMPVLKNSCTLKGRDCIGDSCYDQCSYLFGQARSAGLKITHYHNEKEKKSDFKQSQFVSLGLLGTLAQLQQFLVALKKSCRLIQCSSLSAHRMEQGQFAISCTIQFISPKK